MLLRDSDASGSGASAPVTAAGSSGTVGGTIHAERVDQHDRDSVISAVIDSWADDTCDPADLILWSPSNPSRGQCGATALVLNDLLGGDLVVADVLWPDGTRQGYHYWNRLPDGTELDLTSAQFNQGERVQQGEVVVRPPGPPGRCAEQYARLRTRVLARLRDARGPDQA
jgi:hypothetical protein